ncbi:SAC3 family protein C [Tripterygium wilfordii]|uniref:SAC3 family protein C n=1 Tax=Tripterygium wilfordii TaxID=458696 RepID=UPI0018F863F6|nr:SAC3 family protein C [Tripterygium wilfordii]
MERSRRNPRQRHSRSQKIASNCTNNSATEAGSSVQNDFSDSVNVRDWKTGRTRNHERSGVVEKEEEQEESTDLPRLIGTCPHMCPEGERLQRERLRDLAVFERLHGNVGKTSPGLAVKKFCRTISTKHVRPSDVRPLPVLEDTLNYLLDLLNSSVRPFEVIHDFVFDRMRSIRQDLSMQNIVNDKAIRMYEEMVKFHVISHHQLRSCNSNPNMSSVHYLNMEQLKKTLTSLYNLYEVNQSSNSCHENEPEFRSLYVLLHLDSNSQAMGESLSLWFRLLPSPIIKSKEMCFARSTLRYFRMGNYKLFICITATEASYLQYCVMEPFIDEIRAMAVSCINNGGYKLYPYPLAHLARLLRMKESDLESLCTSCGLEICTDDESNKLLPSKQTTFSRSNTSLQCYSLLGSERF